MSRGQRETIMEQNIIQTERRSVYGIIKRSEEWVMVNNEGPEDGTEFIGE